MAVDEKWYFTKEQLLQSPSRKSGYDVDKELSCRQQAANFIQDMGQRLQVSQLCINTAIVYMHRFYVFHSLAAFHRNAIAAAALFLAAKVEEQPRKLEHVIKVAHMCLHRENPNLDTKSELYLEQAQDLVFNENVLLQTLGFDVAIDHPHTHVVRCCQLVRASKDLAQTSYFMASNSLHLTTMCLQYKPTVVACFCIHLACKWSNWEIPVSNEGKDWFWYIDKTVTKDLLEQLTAEFLAILDKCPTKLKRKMMSMNQNNTPGFTQQPAPHDGLQFEEPRKLTGNEAIKPPEGLFPIQKSSSQSQSDKPGTSIPTSAAHAHHQKIDYREYREKKERERMEREKQQLHQRDGHSVSSNSHHHHSKANIMTNKSHGNVQLRTSSGSVSHKSYQQPPPHGMQQNLHPQNYQPSTSSKDSNYLKQHPPHIEREVNKDSEPNSIKNEVSVDPNKVDSYASDGNKAQSMHSIKMYDTKYKTHHYQASSKSNEVPQTKVEKPSAQCSSELHKKIGERNHDKHRKIQELDRVPHAVDGSGNLSDMSKHQKLSKEVNEKNKLLLPGQHGDQRLKEKMSPSLYQKMKSTQRPSNISFVKSEPGHFSLDGNPNSNANIGERSENSNQPLKPLKPAATEDGGKTLGTFQKQKSHEFGGNMSSSQDSSLTKSNKTSSIFSPDSKIPPQNILSTLEKDSKKNSSTHRSHSSNNKSPSGLTPNSKKSVPGAVIGAMTTSTTSSTGSLFSPPLPKNIPSIPPRHRTPSSGSEPELIPVLTRLKEAPAYENASRGKKVVLTPANEVLPGAEKEKKLTMTNEKIESNSAFLFGSDHKTSSKDIKPSSEIKTNLVKSEVITQSMPSKTAINVKFPNEIRSDLGAVIYPTTPKSLPVSKSSTQGFPSEAKLTETKHAAVESASTVNMIGVEKMVDTSISPPKQANQFGSAGAKPNLNYNPSNPSVNTLISSSTALTMDVTEKHIADQTQNLKTNNSCPNLESGDVDILGYSEKKRSEKKKKKEKHKHKEKDKSERKKEKKKHKTKDKDRSKEKEKYKDKEKHKDKERLKEREIDVVSSETPIKITIPKDKISGSLKFKISKDCLKKEDPDSLKSNTSGELKIKISKDVISNISAYKEEQKSESKKRERSPKSISDLPHPKSMKISEKKSASSLLKPNGTEGSSRNSSSHRYSVSENGSCFDISSLYDCPFDFEENGHGIIKTPDYDFEALNALEYPKDSSNTTPESREIEECDMNSHNELEQTRDDRVATSEPEPATLSESAENDVDVPCGHMTERLPKPVSPLDDHRFRDDGQTLLEIPRTKPRQSNSEEKKDENSIESDRGEIKKDQMISVENCDVLKNYKTILDNHSRRSKAEVLKDNVSPVSPEENPAKSTFNNDDNNNKSTFSTNEQKLSSDKDSLKPGKRSSETENPNYYNKYFKKDGGSRIRPRDEKRMGKGRLDEKTRYDERQRFYESRKYRSDYSDRDRRFYKDYRDYGGKDSSQYYYERKEERRFEYPGYASASQYFAPAKSETTVSGINYDMAANGVPHVYPNVAQAKVAAQFPQNAAVTPNADMNVQYHQYGFFNNYMYTNGGFYGNMGSVPFVNMSLIQQQPIPPGTGESVARVEPPPLPLEPPPDLPPPPETPPPPPK